MAEVAELLVVEQWPKLAAPVVILIKHMQYSPAMYFVYVPEEEVVEDFVVVDQVAMVQLVMYAILQEEYSFEHTPEWAAVVELQVTEKVPAPAVVVLAVASI